MSERMTGGFLLMYHEVAMVILSLSDIHGNIRPISSMSAHFAAADVVLLTGDLTHLGGRGAAHDVVRAIHAETDAFLLAVTGNCDRPDVAAYLAEEDILCEHTCRIIDSMAFVGVGGSLPCPGTTPNEKTEAEFWRELSALAGQIPREYPLIVLSHQPPFDTIADRTTDGRHVGSRSVRRFVEEVHPLVCYCGHIHEGRGTDLIRASEIVNSGPFRDGFYVLTEISDDRTTINIRMCGPETAA